LRRLKLTKMKKGSGRMTGSQARFPVVTDDFVLGSAFEMETGITAGLEPWKRS